MDVSSISAPQARQAAPRRSDAARKWQAAAQSAESPPTGEDSDSELREAFQDFVGKTLFGSLLSSMRKTVGKTPYLHGGRTEEVFQQQLDEHIVDDLTEASADTLADPMYELFNMQRRS